MPAETSDNSYAQFAPNPNMQSGQPPQGWLGWSLAVGVALGLPTGWLLAYLAALPAFLGQFFDLLLGLLIGAAMYRLGRPAAPVPRGHLWAVGGLVAGLVWLTTLAAQYHWFPDDAAQAVIRNSISSSMNTEDLQKFMAGTRRYALDQLREKYPPGGFLGYIRWAATNRQMEIPRPGKEPPFLYHIRGTLVIWYLQLFLSLSFLLFAIESQLLGLAKIDGEAKHDAADAPDEQPPREDTPT